MKSRFDGAAFTRTRTLVRGVVCGALFARAVGAQLDTSAHYPSLFTWRDGVLGAGFVLGTISIRPLDKSAANTLQTPSWQKNEAFKKAAFGFRTIGEPGAIVIGAVMYTAGRIGHDRRSAELGLYGTEAILVGGGAANLLKNVFGRARPFVDTVPNPDNWQLLRGFTTNDRYRSFPSGHTVAGFAAAAAVSAETSRWWPHAIYVIGPAMYGGAAMIGLSRMYDNRHWASDVIMGAAIGTFAGTKVVRYHRTHPNNRLDRWLLNASVSPGDLRHLTFSVLPDLR